MSKESKKTKKDDLESRFRKMEVHLAYLTGAATVLITAVLVFLGATSWYTIPTAVEKQISSEIGEETKEKLDDAKKKADSILSASVLQDKVKSLDERASNLKKDVKNSIDESSSNLQKDVKSINKSISDLQKEVGKINKARLCKNPVKECICQLDKGTVEAKLVVCVSRCPDGRLRGIEIKEIVSTGHSVTCNNLPSNVSWH
jgi:septal ring factor EnvC (AmiA/AmiB activator)